MLRGKDAELCALSNVCRHRGTILLDAGTGNASQLVCPYHAWSYDTKGKLKGIPYAGDVEIDREAHCLPQFQLEVWAGIIFINLDSDAAPLAQRLTGIDRYLGKFQIDRFEEAGNFLSWEWNANWKLIVENAMDWYHVFRLHGETIEPFSATKDSRYIEGSAAWSISASKLRPPIVKRPDHPNAFGEFELTGTPIFTIPPNLVSYLTADSWDWLAILPSAADRCVVTWNSLRAPGTASIPAVSEYSASGVFDQLMEEDPLLCERVQRGMRARHGKGGSLVSLDRPIANLHRYLGWRLFDTEPPKQWIAPE